MRRRGRKIGARPGALVLLLSLTLLCACARLTGAMRPAAVHVVRPGETIEWIAKGYGVSTERIARANRLDPGDRIAPGQRLRVPGRIVHRVRPGETSRSIASLYRVEVSTISRLNRLGPSGRVEPGQQLLMPREARLPAPGKSGLRASRTVAARKRVAPEPERVVPEPEQTAPQPERIAPEPEPVPEPERVAAAPPPVAAAPPPAPPRETDPDLERARALVERSFEDYRAARFERALERANEAEQMLARDKSRDSSALSARAVFVSGSALAALGETDRARAAFARVHALDPQFDPPDGWLSPRLEALYLAAGNP